MKAKTDSRLKLAQEYFDELQAIAHYLPSEKLLRVSEKLYGVSRQEALEMAYDNMLETAKAAVCGRRRPK